MDLLTQGEWEMEGAWWTKLAVLIVATLAAIVLLIPTFWSVDREDPASWPGWYSFLVERVPNRITPGLDLQGGLLLQYQVDVDRALSDRMDRFADDLRRSIRRAHPDAQVTIGRVPGLPSLRVSAQGRDVRPLLDDDLLSLMNLRMLPEAGGGVRLDLSSEFVEQVRSTAVDQVIETIRSRIDALGVAEPSLTRRGDTDVIVQMPGLSQDQFDNAKELIGTTAILQFKMVSNQDGGFFQSASHQAVEGLEQGFDRPRAPRLDLIRQAYENVEAPEGTEIAYQEVERFNAQTGRAELIGYEPILLEAAVRLTGEYVTDARVSQDPQTNRPVVSLTLDASGARIFGEMTRENVGRQMAIVLDGVVSSAPRINEPILGGRVQITMGRSGSYQEIFASAERLTIVLRNGALQAPIELQFETQVGPTLGEQAVRSGASALVVAFLLVLLFVVYWYKVAGAVTVLALLLNVLFILAMLALFNATMTLPGIAGITLTIGMAVDANIIIYERIKEELRDGRTMRAALHAGYEKAFSAIIDANITTGIACIILWTYGSGPVRGFAITLFVGILCSLYTALIVTRLVFDYLLDGAKLQRISI